MLVGPVLIVLVASITLITASGVTARQPVSILYTADIAGNLFEVDGDARPCVRDARTGSIIQPSGSVSSLVCAKVKVKIFEISSGTSNSSTCRMKQRSDCCTNAMVALSQLPSSSAQLYGADIF